MKKPLILPKFRDEDEERDFWDKIDITEYFDPSDFKRLSITELLASHRAKTAKPKTRKITIRIPEEWIEKTKEISGKMDIPYQSLMKQFIHKGLQSSR